MEEEWKDIPGYPGYKISNLGRVVSYKRYSDGREIKGAPDKDGYYHILLYNLLGVRHTFKIHRLVAKAFVYNPHPDRWNIVNHKDENITNNRADNLEWCNVKYNTNYGTGLERRHTKYIDNGFATAVTAYKDGKYLYFESMEQCHRKLGMSTSDIQTLVSGIPGENYKHLKSLKGWQIVKQGNEKYIILSGVNSRPVSKRLVCFVDNKYEIYFPSQASASKYLNISVGAIKNRIKKNICIEGLIFKYI